MIDKIIHDWLQDLVANDAILTKELLEEMAAAPGKTTADVVRQLAYNWSAVPKNFPAYRLASSLVKFALDSANWEGIASQFFKGGQAKNSK